MKMNKLLKGLLGAAVTVAMFGTVNAQAQTSESTGSNATAQDQSTSGSSTTKKHTKKRLLVFFS